MGRRRRRGSLRAGARQSRTEPPRARAPSSGTIANVSQPPVRPDRPLAALSPEELRTLHRDLETAYAGLRDAGLKLDLTRGKPGADQLDLSDGLLTLPRGTTDSRGTDVRNYGGLEGLPDLRAIFAELLGTSVDQLVAGDNSSLVMMRSVLSYLWLHGGVASPRPWSAEEKVTFVCPVPGYDRHFTLLEWFG